METVMQVDPTILFLYSLKATILALVSLLVAIVAFVRNATKLVQELQNIFGWFMNFVRSKQNSKEPNMKVTRRNLVLMFFIILLITPSVAVWMVRASESLPLPVRMMIEVWDAFNKAKKTKNEGDYQKTIERATALIEEFEPGAEGDQKRLVEEKVPIPKKGKCSKEERERFFNFGPLHEISAAWWVKGRSLQALGRNQEAIQAYEKAEQYPHAIVFDPSSDGCWSPAQDAKDRVDYMRRNQKAR